jgi:hypothetical protein
MVGFHLSQQIPSDLNHEAYVLDHDSSKWEMNNNKTYWKLYSFEN